MTVLWLLLRPLRRRLRRRAVRHGLIEYCARCDGSTWEANARGYGFETHRWRWHRRHERARNDAGAVTPVYPWRGGPLTTGDGPRGAWPR